MLLNEDLPEPWRVEQSVIAEADDLDVLLGQSGPLADEDRRVLEGDAASELMTQGASEALSKSWSLLRNVVSGQLALVRMQRPSGRPGAIASGVTLLPARPGERVTSADLRDFPIAAIEAAADARQYEGASIIRILLELGPEFDPMARLGSPRADERFYERVAAQFSNLRATGEPHVAKVMAELNGKPVSTIHNWLAETRRRGYLAAGKRGRAR